MSPTHRRDPTTAQRGNFRLLGFPPDLFRFSLDNLDPEDSSIGTMSTLSLVRTPVQHRKSFRRTSSLKSAATPSSPVAGLQKCATLPADNVANVNIFQY